MVEGGKAKKGKRGMNEFMKAKEIKKAFFLNICF